MASAPTVSNANRKIALDLIEWAEGVAHGYNTLFGNKTFSSFADHPRIRFPYKNTTTSAAGRYQFEIGTWDGLVRQYHFPSFAPEYQDQAALALIAGQRGALADVDAGRWSTFIEKCSGQWASFPGNVHHQGGQKTLPDMLDSIRRLGGGEDISPSTANKRAVNALAKAANGLTLATEELRVHLLAQFPAISPRDIGGVAARPDNPNSDHPSGRAIDVTMGTLGKVAVGAQRALGDSVAEWALNQPGVNYVIWMNRIRHPGGDWKPYAEHGPAVNQQSISGRHEDHVHVSMLKSAMGDSAAAEQIALDHGAGGELSGGGNIDPGLDIGLDLFSEASVVELVGGISTFLLSDATVDVDLSTKLVSEVTITFPDPGFEIRDSGAFSKGQTLVTFAGWPMVVSAITSTAGNAGTGQLVLQCRAILSQLLKEMKGPDLVSGVSPSDVFAQKCGFYLAQPTVVRQEPFGPADKQPGKKEESWFDTFHKLATDEGFLFFEVAGKGYFAQPSYIIASIDTEITIDTSPNAEFSAWENGLVDIACRTTIDDPDNDTVVTLSVLAPLGVLFRPGFLMQLVGQGPFDGPYLVSQVKGRVEKTAVWEITCIFPKDPEPAAAATTDILIGGDAGTEDDGTVTLESLTTGADA